MGHTSYVHLHHRAKLYLRPFLRHFLPYKYFGRFGLLKHFCSISHVTYTSYSSSREPCYANRASAFTISQAIILGKVTYDLPVYFGYLTERQKHQLQQKIM